MVDKSSSQAFMKSGNNRDVDFAAAQRNAGRNRDAGLAVIIERNSLGTETNNQVSSATLQGGIYDGRKDFFSPDVTTFKRKGGKKTNAAGNTVSSIITKRSTQNNRRERNVSISSTNESQILQKDVISTAKSNQR